jgi:hypothetical protein
MKYFSVKNKIMKFEEKNQRDLLTSGGIKNGISCAVKDLLCENEIYLLIIIKSFA